MKVKEGEREEGWTRRKSDREGEGTKGLRKTGKKDGKEWEQTKVEGKQLYGI